ncbi:MAG TPA: BamA/TamA family outer membrane protein, partial [Sphingomicrobium sp.]|nr:BamA/TamA family outer membrane protein [Sphingomicrobium sp.]
NFMGKGQSLDASVNWSRYSRSVELGFVDPYFMDKPILFGGNLFRRDYRSFNFIGNERNTTYSQTSTGGALRMGFPITEYWSFGGRYTLSNDKITLDKTSFYTDPDLIPDPDGSGPLTGTNGPLPLACDPIKAGRYLCDEIGTRLTSLLGFSTIYDDTDGIHPTRGQRLTLSEDFAGLGGNVRYIRSRIDATKYKKILGNWVFSIHGEGGYIVPLQKARNPDNDAVRLTDRFFDPGLRGFDIRGIGPRIQRVPYNTDGTLALEEARVTDALGGRAYYMGRLELEFPVSAGIKSLGLRPSAFVDVGSLWKIKRPQLLDIKYICSPTATNTTDLVSFTSPAQDCSVDYTGVVHVPANFSSVPGFQEQFLGNSPRPRLSVGVGVNWVSPFGPLRIDIAKALLKQKGDDTKLFSFNVGTQF